MAKIWNAKMSELKDINLTMGQMQAILFMMDEEGI
jgi:hypothetical protein